MRLEHFSLYRRAHKPSVLTKTKAVKGFWQHSSDLQILVNSGLFSAVFNLCLCLPAAGADHQAPLAAFPPVLTFRTASPRRPLPPPPPQRASPSCCGSSGLRSPSSCSSCSSSAWPAWCQWPRRTTAATTPTTSPAPSIPCCATPTDLHPYEKQLNIYLLLCQGLHWLLWMFPLHPVPWSDKTLPAAGERHAWWSDSEVIWRLLTLTLYTSTL